MPTTISLVSRGVNPEVSPRDLSAEMMNPDFIVISTIAVIGVLMAVGLAVGLPSPDQWLVPFAVVS